MMLIVAQVTAFFEGAYKMATPHNTRLQLQSEDITYSSDLADFTEEDMAMISQNLRRPRGSKIRILMLLQEPPYQHHISCLELKMRYVS